MEAIKSYSVKQLKNIVATHNASEKANVIKAYSKMKKPELVKAITQQIKQEHLMKILDALKLTSVVVGENMKIKVKREPNEMETKLVEEMLMMMENAGSKVAKKIRQSGKVDEMTSKQEKKIVDDFMMMMESQGGKMTEKVKDTARTPKEKKEQEKKEKETKKTEKLDNAVDLFIEYMNDEHKNDDALFNLRWRGIFSHQSTSGKGKKWINFVEEAISDNYSVSEYMAEDNYSGFSINSNSPLTSVEKMKALFYKKIRDEMETNKFPYMMEYEDLENNVDGVMDDFYEGSYEEIVKDIEMETFQEYLRFEGGNQDD